MCMTNGGNMPFMIIHHMLHDHLAGIELLLNNQILIMQEGRI